MLQGVPSSSGGGAVPLIQSGGFAAEDEEEHELEGGVTWRDGAVVVGAGGGPKGHRVCDACFGTLRCLPTRKALQVWL
jgi:hypothetical protein